MKRLVFGLSALLMAGGPVTAEASNDPQHWLERMGAAMSQMSYQGTFVYISGSHLETMRITHVVDNQGIQERLVSISGPRREVVRDKSGVHWMSGEDGDIMADPVVNWPIFLDQSEHDLSATDGQYSLKLGGLSRIAELKSQQVDVIAADNYRYSYSLWLEVGSGLLLQWEITDHSGSSLARLAFTELKMGSEVDTKELQVTRGSNKHKKSGLPPSDAQPVSAPSPWHVQWLPPGFRMTGRRVPSEGTSLGFQHQVFSDGIASISVYIEPAEAAQGIGKGLKKLGTSHIFGRQSDDMLITVVGDVPAITVEKVAKSVVFSKP